MDKSQRPQKVRVKSMMPFNFTTNRMSKKPSNVVPILECQKKSKTPQHSLSRPNMHLYVNEGNAYIHTYAQHITYACTYVVRMCVRYAFYVVGKPIARVNEWDWAATDGNNCTSSSCNNNNNNGCAKIWVKLSKNFTCYCCCWKWSHSKSLMLSEYSFIQPTTNERTDERANKPTDHAHHSHT